MAFYRVETFSKKPWWRRSYLRVYCDGKRMRGVTKVGYETSFMNPSKIFVEGVEIGHGSYYRDGVLVVSVPGIRELKK
jgi:hypothetical protein